MRIAILTLPLNTNYGGILQAWALQRVIERLGHRTHILMPKKASKKIDPIFYLKRFARKCIGIKSDTRIFEEFIRKHTEGTLPHFISHKLKIKYIPSLSSFNYLSYDAIVVGSDQIWRKELVNIMWNLQVSADAFLGFIKDNRIKRIAYSASLGTNTWGYSLQECAYIAKELKQFSGISVREDSAVEIIKSATGCDAVHVLDPTMLLTAADYQSLFSMKFKGSGGLISYILDPTEKIDEFVDKIANSRGLKRTELNNITLRKKLGIEKWLAEMSSAEFIVTDSFHGCVFSIIFRKPFVFLNNDERGNARFDSLVNTFGIKENRLNDFSQYNNSKSYSLPENIDSTMKSMQKRSMDFLLMTLN